MKDEEFERIKEAEKERLRVQKRLRNTIESLKRRNEVQQVVRRMSQGAKRLLDKTEAFAEEVASQAARHAARLEVAADEELGTDSSLSEDEESLREERAAAVVHLLKTEEEPRAASDSSTSSARSGEEAASDEADEEASDVPDKTIGRMGDSGRDAAT